MSLLRELGRHWGAGSFQPRGDAGRDRNARSLHVALWVGLGGVALATLMNYLFGAHSMEFPTLLCGTTGFLAALYVNSRGRPEWAARIASLTILLTVALLVAQAKDGLRSIAMLLLPGLLVLAMLVLDSYFYSLLALLSVLLVTVLGIAEIQGLTANIAGRRTPTTFLTIIQMDIILLVVAVFGWVVARNLQRTAAETRKAMNELASANRQLQLSELRYRSLIDHAVDAIFVTNEAGIILEANRQASRLCGVPPDQLAGRPLGKVIQPAQPGEEVFPLSLLLQGEPVVTRGRVAGAESAEIPVELNSMKMDEGRIECFCRDITERLASEQTVAHLQKMESIGRLAGGVAHDFNNLLTIINGYSDLLAQRTSAADPNRGDIELIRNAGQRAAKLTRQLLVFSRKDNALLQPVDLNKLVLEGQVMIERLLGADVELCTHLRNGSVRVRGDAGELHQVVMNLAVNARDAMPSGGTITITTTGVHLASLSRDLPPGSPPGSYAVLSVSDTGTGMDPDTRRRIFEPFFTTKEIGRGTGLGLPMVHAIVHKYGGWIAVDTAPGHGSVFRIYLPELLETLPQEVATSEQPASPTGAATILLVEDQEEVRHFISRVLSTLGFNILEASHGPDALIRYGAHPEPIHLLLTDIEMPQMKGNVLADRFLNLRPDIRVLLMSGYTEKPGFAGNHPFIQKPFSPSDLARKIKSVLAAEPATSS